VVEFRVGTRGEGLEDFRYSGVPNESFGEDAQVVEVGDGVGPEGAG